MLQITPDFLGLREFKYHFCLNTISGTRFYSFNQKKIVTVEDIPWVSFSYKILYRKD